jgi:hypothetical protein
MDNKTSGLLETALVIGGTALLIAWLAGQYQERVSAVIHHSFPQR